MQFEQEYEADYKQWLAEAFEELTDDRIARSPSEWAEQERYLPASVTPLPGPFSYDVCPPMREIVDCMDVRCPIRHVVVKKGVQVTATVGVLEPVIGYAIAQVKDAPMALVTADAELAKIRVESNIVPMIQQSGLTDAIQSSDAFSAGKTGKTDKKIEWSGGGYLLPLGAQNPNKFRSVSIQFMLRDEIDAYPWSLGKDGCPLVLLDGRTSAYSETKKVLDLSTPTVKGLSKIDDMYELGDKSKCLLPCRNCGKMQELIWQGHDTDTGEMWGMDWELDEEGTLIRDSVVYKCRHCFHPHRNADKNWMLPRFKWQPTVKPKKENTRSFLFPALYSPVGMYAWADAVDLWLQAWNVETNNARDVEKLQVFYNNVLGLSFEKRGHKLKFSTVSGHRRDAYKLGEVNNHFAVQHCGGPIGLLICTVDVHDKNLAVTVTGWSRGTRAHVIDYWRFEGECSTVDDKPTWERLKKLITGGEYVATDGRIYPIALTLVDSGHLQDVVYTFCAQFEGGVYPIKGRQIPVKTAAVKEFSEFTTPLSIRAFNITVDLYKERWSASLRRDWDGIGVQPEMFFNAPVNMSDKQIKELTVEYRVEKKDPKTNKRIGFEWHRPGNAANELWDNLVYANGGLDMLIVDICTDPNHLNLEEINAFDFWDYVEKEEIFYKSE